MRHYLIAIVAAAVLTWDAASAQNLDAGKTPPQLFSSHCSACHRNPQGLGKGQSAGSVAGFLLQHYTTNRETAGALGAYVAAMPEPRQSSRQTVAAPAADSTDPRLPGAVPQSGQGRLSPAPAEARATPRGPVRRPGEPASVEGDPPPLTVQPEARPVVLTEAERARQRQVFDSPGLRARTAEAPAQQSTARDAPPSAPPGSASPQAAPSATAPETTGSQPATFSDPVP